MRILVTAASRHGSTLDIATAIRDELEATGLDVDLMLPEQVTSLGAYDAVVLGSGVYAGRWLAPARALVDRLAAELVTKRVWLFSSGPIGDPPKPAEPSVDGLAIAERTRAEDHQTFEGRIDRSQLGLGERTVLRVVGAPDGDFRQWEAVLAWARRIASSLQTGARPDPVAVPTTVGAGAAT